jgi:HD-GYP domain-containing protein (c-di-GMP phosphodiesterase class II)
VATGGADGALLRRWRWLASAFRHIATDAARHYERLDGKGYPWRIPGERLSFMARVLAFAEVNVALTADRPYRAGLPVATVVDIMVRDRGRAFDANRFVAAVALAEKGTFASLAQLSADGCEQFPTVVNAAPTARVASRVA